MQARLLAAASLLLLGALTAGCSGHTSDRSRQAPGDPATIADSDQGRISGTVIDSEFRPVPGAAVSLEDLDDTRATTDADGRFRFDSVPPGSYTLRAELAGYAPAAKKVTASAGTLSEVRITLLPLPAKVAHTDEFQHDGYMTVGASMPLYTIRPGTYVNDKLTFTHNVSADAQGIVSGLVWQSSAPLTAKRMRLDVIVNDNLYNQSSGPSPLANRVQDLLTRKDGTATYEIWLPLTCDYYTSGTCVANPPDSLLVVVYEQRFHLYSTIFYQAPPPADYPPVPEN